MTRNIILAADAYKHSHFLQYPEHTTQISSYIEARTGGDYDKVLFFGLQAVIKEYFTKPITLEDIKEAEDIVTGMGLPFNREGWLDILYTHRGFLPLEILSIPEGVVVPAGTPLVKVRNTDPKHFWLTSFVETLLLRGIWYPSTVATLSWYIKQDLRAYLEKSTDDDRIDGVLDFMLHDFGARGVSSSESAGLGGLAHLINFKGTDTIESQVAQKAYYPTMEGVSGFSVPASEHSTMTSWGRAYEASAYANMLEKFPDGIVSIVADSYDLFDAVTNIFGGGLKDDIIERGGRGSRTVIRPDSGDPAYTVLETVTRLGDAFGRTTNSKGYFVLPDYIRVLQGDGVNHKSINRILKVLTNAGWSAENVVFGMGGALLQQPNRDTLRFAMKASLIEFAGGLREIVQKTPKTDPAKASKGGVIDVDRIIGTCTLRVHQGRTVSRRVESDAVPFMFSVFVGGDLWTSTPFEAIRDRAVGPAYSLENS